MKILKFAAIIVSIILVVSLLGSVTYFLVRGFDPFSLLSEPVADDTHTVLHYKEAEGKPLEIHFYEPTRKVFRKSPLLIYIHGGSWKKGSHSLDEDELDIVNPLRDYGMAVASVQYRLTDENNKFPDHINDVTDAIRYLSLHSEEYGIDRKYFCELGGSAGAHLALLAAFAQDEFHDSPTLADVRYDIKCTVSLSTPCDLVDLSCYEGNALREVEELLEGFLGYTFEQNPGIYSDASPVTYINSNKIPVFMAHGEKDNVVPIIQADNYYAKAVQAGMKIEYIRVLNGKHGLGSNDGGPIYPSKDELLKKLVMFILRNLM